MERTLTPPAAATIVPPIAMTDGELLMRFARHGDEQAFAALVEKHGRLVWTVCWQVLREHHAIEDAFQSTFFILAKRAKSIRSCDSLCGWLYRVAYRTALRARMSSKSKAISALGTEADTMEEWSALDEKLRAIEQDEQRAALLEELQALPEKYQQALALCYLEGKTRRMIADELGCSLETVKGRLARGRQVLRHRLIRRGVSLSLAMAAMAVPVKSATAAVTPSLIGLTVTGATAWAAGTLGATKIASGAGAAKVAATASSQVINLAHQGTVAMTIASFAKPAVLAVALLGAVSATLAVDSADATQGGDAVQAIELQADSADATGDASAGDVVVEAEAPVLTVRMADATEGADKGDKGTLKLEGKLAVGVATEKKRVPAPPRTPQPIKIRTPAPPADVLINAMPPMPDIPVTAPLNVRVPKLDLKLHLKLAQLESRVSQLQLESKKLEIASFHSEGEEQEELLKASKEKLIEAEAERLKIQIEQQEEQIKALEEALKQQAKELGKQAAKMAAEAGQVAIQAEKAATIEAAKAAVQAREAAEQAAQAVKWKIQERAVYVDPNSGQPFADPASQVPATATITQATGGYPAAAVFGRALPTWEQSIEAQQGALSLKPGDRIQIEIIDGDAKNVDVYTVEPMGTVPLGADYGRAEVQGMSVIDAEDVIKAVIGKVIENAKVQVTYLHPTVTYSSTYVPPGKSLQPHYAPTSNSESSESKESH